MPTVKCPHCGAGNQDASETDRCWQCETVLGNPSTLTNVPMNPIVAATRQLDPNMAKNIAPTRSTASSQRTYTLMLLVSVLAFAIVLVIVLLLLTGRR